MFKTVCMREACRTESWIQALVPDLREGWYYWFRKNCTFEKSGGRRGEKLPPEKREEITAHFEQCEYCYELMREIFHDPPKSIRKPKSR